MDDRKYCIQRYSTTLIHAGKQKMSEADQAGYGFKIATSIGTSLSKLYFSAISHECMEKDF